MPNITNPIVLDETLGQLVTKTQAVVGKIKTPKSDWNETDSQSIAYIANKPDIYSERTITGNPAIVKVGSHQVAKRVSASIVPIQSGTGNPSPTNVRPISGTESVTITITDDQETVLDTFTISFTSPAYCGVLGINNGDLFKTFDAADMGDMDWTLVDGTTNMFKSNYVSSFISKPTSTSVVTTAICSHYTAYSYDTISAQATLGFAVNTDGSVVVYNSDYTDASTFKSAMKGATICYKLISPLIGFTTPHDVNLSIGTNKVYTDADSVTFTYTDDHSSITDLADEASALLANIATIENSSKASKAYAKNDYMIYDGSFCKVTSAISSGGMITIGTNVSKTTIAAELKALA